MQNIIELFKKNKFIIFVIVSLCLIITLSIPLIFPKKDTTPEKSNSKYVFELFGPSEMTIYLGDEYVDPGYFAFYNNIEETDNVKVLGNVNVNKAGTYKIYYKIGNETLTRKITVITKQPEIVEKEENQDITFKLLGDEKIRLNLNQTYQELGFEAMDSDGNNIKSYVKINNQVNTSQVGTYNVIYSLKYNNKMYELKREVEVIQPLDIFVEYNHTTYVKELVLNIFVTGTNFKFLKLPNQVLTKGMSVTYKITNNGTYTFYAYDKDGNCVEKTIQITNIDNTIDKASCTLNVKVKSSSISIQASDYKSGIKSFKFNGREYTTTTINVDSKLSSAEVLVSDAAGNTKTIRCGVNVTEEVYGFILIGDSRFVGMETYLGSNKRPNDTFVAKGAMGWDWFLKTAIAKVNAILKQNPNRKYYIFCNLGVNDYKYHYNDANYAIKLSELAKSDWKDHIVGYISVNPYASSKDSRNARIVVFNERQKNSLNGVYYCDTYNGIGLSNFEPRKSSDTTHYNKKTSIDIYNYIINNCSF